jgi:drug/metabolite transporter (DMT)-like permease
VESSALYHPCDLYFTAIEVLSGILKPFMLFTSTASPWAWITQRLHHHTAHLSPTARALLWAVSAGLLFNLLNAVMRGLAQQIHPFQAQFLRYVFGLVVLLPFIVRHGMATYRPKSLGGQFTRGALHSVGLFFWFAALPKIPLADMTAIGFSTPIFIMLGAYIFLHEPMRWERWVATALGFGGVLMVVGPQLAASGGHSGLYHLLMLASAPLFAASFLVTKALTRYETTGTILVWQGITVTLFSLPMALLHWSALNAWQWAGFLLCGGLGTMAHFCLTRSFKRADISATQSLKFLELVWSALLGWLLFSDVPTVNAIMGGVVISAATIWVARRESRPFQG